MTCQDPEAIFFDFDGVLVDSNKIKTQAFRELFEGYGADVVDAVVQYHQLHGGISRVEKIRYAFENIMERSLSPNRHKELADKYSQSVLDKVIHAAWINGAKEFLQLKHTQVFMFVISGTPDNELKEILHERKMSHYFREILGSPIKKPFHIRSLLADYNLEPGKCIFVGDAFTDYHAAADTGLHFVGIQGDVTFPPGTVVLPDCTRLDEAIRDLRK